MKKILIVDDDAHIGNILEDALKFEGYQVLRAYSGTEAMMILEKSKTVYPSIDLILLDMMLPGLSGEDILPAAGDIPVIVVSAKIDTDDKVNMLLNGACDYITKPFDMDELLARIAVQFRGKNDASDRKTIELRNLSLDTSFRIISCGDRYEKLTPTECAILKLLMLNPRQVITKSQVLERISADTPDCTESSLKMHVSNLRKKLGKVNENIYIESVYGIGFRLS